MYVADAAIEALVALFGTPEAAVLLAPILAGQTYDLLHVCGAPQPADPIITATDFANALNFTDIVNNQAAISRLRQWFIYTIWPTWCSCADGTIPEPQPPAALPHASVNPGLPSGSQNAPCWDVAGSFALPDQSPTFDMSSRLLPYTHTVAVAHGPDNTPAQAAVMPPGISNVQITSTLSRHPVGTSVSVALFFWDSTNNAEILVEPVASFTGATALTQTTAVTIPSGAVSWIVGEQKAADSGLQLQEHISFTCSGEPPAGLNTPCCPPDPNLAQRLTRIEQLEQIIIQLLGQPLKHHIDGTRHAGLTGAASINLVDSVTAIRVEVKSSLAGFQVNPGVPSYYFSIGFVTSIAAGSPLKGWRLVYQEQTYPIVDYADQIGFDLAPGVVIDIVELLPSP